MHYIKVKLDRMKEYDPKKRMKKQVYVPMKARNTGRTIKVGDYIHLEDDPRGIIWHVMNVGTDEKIELFFIENPKQKRSRTVTVHGHYSNEK
jgi:hypothetical protein